MHIYRNFCKHVQSLFKDKNNLLLLHISRNCNNLTSNEQTWVLPEGYDTGIILYNTATKSKVPLIINNNRIVKWYMCGPTVYDHAHIGHASCYMRFDIIRRILQDIFNLKVVTAMSITDVDDKTIQKSREMNISLNHLCKKYEHSFFEDLSQLNILHPDIVLNVTSHIPQIIHFCQVLLNKGHAYVTDDGSMYFDSSFKKLGVLRDESNLKEYTNENAESYPGKRAPQDFSLWKGAKPGEPRWDTPWGSGRPGWHIECSAMASSVFGSQIDIHSGGYDLVFPHHENEITQSHSYHSTSQWVNYWIHPALLHLANDVKMSKSLNNTITIKDLLDNYSMNDFRLLCLITHYRHPIEFSYKNMDETVKIKNKITDFLTLAESYVNGSYTCGPLDESLLTQSLLEAEKTVSEAYQDDFNTPRVVHALLALIHKFNTQLLVSSTTIAESRSPSVVQACHHFLHHTLSKLGMDIKVKRNLLSTRDQQSIKIHSALDTLVKFRAKIRHFALTSGPTAYPSFDRQEIDPSSFDKEEDLPQPPENPPPDKEDQPPWTTRAQNKKDAKVALTRKSEDPLLQACDEVRRTLSIYGIKIKDHGKDSSWSFEETTSKTASGSNPPTLDAFDPDYKPRQKQ